MSLNKAARTYCYAVSTVAATYPISLAVLITSITPSNYRQHPISFSNEI